MRACFIDNTDALVPEPSPFGQHDYVAHAGGGPVHGVVEAVENPRRQNFRGKNPLFPTALF